MFNIKKYREIKDFLQKSNKNAKIIAISKNHPLESVEEAVRHGVYIFGENRVNEAISKFVGLKEKNQNIELHLTGPLQSNKVKHAIRIFDVFHTLDREKIAREFTKYPDIIKNKKIFVQVNTGEEDTKSGIYIKELKDFLNFCNNEINLTISGLMCIPPIDQNPHDHFKTLKKLAIDNNLSEISIGMSNDYEAALDFNPTYIRLGTILFGKRQWKRL